MAESRKGSPRAFALLALAFLLGSLLFLLPETVALPTGATVTNISTSSVGTGTPENRTDARGTITTLLLDAVQQDQFWKAYVGNVTGVLTLDDAAGNTIYDWSFVGVTITGEVYATRNGSTTFTGIQCAQEATIATEEAFNNMTAGDLDSINSTFNYTEHTPFRVGDTLLNGNCPCTYTYVNDTKQNVTNASSKFQEILIEDAVANLIYVTLIEDNEPGYDVTRSFDFQMIVAESDTESPHTYYFFTEISS